MSAADRQTDMAFRDHLRNDHMLLTARGCSDAHVEDLAAANAGQCEDCAVYCRANGVQAWEIEAQR